MNLIKIFKIKRNLKKLKPHSLPYKIFMAMVLLIITTIIITSFIWYTIASSSLEKNAKEYLFSSVETIDSQLDSYLKMINSTANNIAYGYPQYRYVITNGPYDDYSRYMPEVHSIEKNILQNIFAFSNDLNAVAIVSRSGYIFKAGNLINNTNPLEQEYIQHAMNGKYRVVYKRNIRTYFKEALTMAVPIKFEGVVAGVVLMDVSYKSILDIYALQIKKLSGNGSRIISILPDGEILYDSGQQQSDTSSTFPVDDSFKKVLELQNNVSHSGSIKINGKEYIIANILAEYTGIRTVGIVSVADLRSSANSVFSWSLVIVLILIVIVMGATFLITKQTTKNLMVLEKTMIRVGKDGIGIRADIKGNDEISHLASTFNTMMHRVEELMNKITQKEKILHQMEIDVFRSQINPHFLYNTLMTISYLAKLRGARNIDDVAQSLTRILRVILDKADDSSTLEDDLQLLENYMRIQKYKYAEVITLSLNIAPELGNAIIPKMILQPLVENALIHGYGGEKKCGIIEITVEQLDQDLLISVKDNGQGIENSRIQGLLSLTEPDREEKDGRIHIGIRNVHRRLQLLYGTDYGLRIDSCKGEYTKVTAYLPLKFKEKRTQEERTF